MKKRSIVFIILSVLAAAALTAALWVFYARNIRVFTEDADDSVRYSRSYLFVSGDDSQMLEKIYDAAKESAQKNDAYLTWAGKDSPVTYTAAECVDIAIASDADGLIVYPDQSEEMEDAVKRAAEADIPVVTILQDLQDTGRVSHVGVSGYQLGELYGQQVEELLSKDSTRVCLLQDEAMGEVTSNLIYGRVLGAIQSSEHGDAAEFTTRQVDTSNDFEAEETIRNLLISEDAPDILLCVNPVQTECSVTAIIDYNLVSEVQIIGYYASEDVLTALRQELLPVTITINPEEAGESAVSALDEYIESGNVSDYINLSLEAVRSDEVFLYLRRLAARKRAKGGG